MKTFFGGTYLKDNKKTAHLPIKDAQPVKKVVIPLSQHTGSPSEAIVKVGDKVKTGQLIAKATGFISANIHASISGTITAIESMPHPILGKAPAIAIEADEVELKDEGLLSGLPQKDLTAKDIRDIVFNCGIVGMGGAAFPTHVKLTIPEGKNIEFLILNGAECEPYLTCDHRLMLEKTTEIVEGLILMMKAIGVKKAFIAIEDNKEDAIKAMKSVIKAKDLKRFFDISAIRLHTKYPQGAEKQLINVITGREVPSGGLPFDVGVVVGSVATSFSIYEAVHLNKPLYERTITVGGDCIRQPLNIRVRIGTLLTDIIQMCEGLIEEPKAIIFGGPMMGIAQYTKDLPVLKGTSGILFLSERNLKMPKDLSCIRCGRCIQSCPVRIQPTIIALAIQKDKFDIAKDFDCLDCIECGVCSFVCPSKINLVHYIKYGKLKARS